MRSDSLAAVVTTAAVVAVTTLLAVGAAGTGQMAVALPLVVVFLAAVCSLALSARAWWARRGALAVAEPSATARPETRAVMAALSEIRGPCVPTASTESLLTAPTPVAAPHTTSGSPAAPGIPLVAAPSGATSAAPTDDEPEPSVPPSALRSRARQSGRRPARRTSRLAPRPTDRAQPGPVPGRPGRVAGTGRREAR